MVVHFREHVPRDVRLPARGVDIEMNKLLHLPPERLVGPEDGGDRRRQPPRRLREHRLGQPVLGAEVVVQQRLVHPCLVGDLLHPRPSRSMADEGIPRRSEDALFGLPIGGWLAGHGYPNGLIS